MFSEGSGIYLKNQEMLSKIDSDLAKETACTSQEVVVYTFNPGTQEANAGGSL